MNAPMKAYERFLSSLPAHSARKEPNHRMYESLKRDFIEACPGATPQQYEAAMRAIAKATGV